jgi:hypothetical protein
MWRGSKTSGCGLRWLDWLNCKASLAMWAMGTTMPAGLGRLRGKRWEVNMHNLEALVARFDESPVPAPGDPVNLDAARALVEWMRHPEVCSGGPLADEYVPPYLEALAAEVERLRHAVDAALEWAIDTGADRLRGEIEQCLSGEWP